MSTIAEDWRPPRAEGEDVVTKNRATGLSEAAFDALEARPGFESRAVQREMAKFILGCAQVGEHGLIEAPTGVGKSLGAIIPAIAWAIAEEKRVVVATYTNVLAEQYWRNDLLLALELLGEAAADVRTEIVMGKARYVCRARVGGDEASLMDLKANAAMRDWLKVAERGVENEWAAFARRRQIRPQEAANLWSAVNVPPVCAQRQCPDFHRCYYFRTRRNAGQAQVVVTNHSVILADAEMRHLTGGRSSLLDEYDLLVLDEAHDLLSSTRSATEVVLNGDAVVTVSRTAARMVNQLSESMKTSGIDPMALPPIHEFTGAFSRRMNGLASQLDAWLGTIDRNAIVAADPRELFHNENVERASRRELLQPACELVGMIRKEVEQFFGGLRKLVKKLTSEAAGTEDIREMLQQQAWWFKKFVGGLRIIGDPHVGVSWADAGRMGERALRAAALDFSELLSERVWSVVPTIAMSATLCVDGSFDFFQVQTGLRETGTLRLPQTFDYQSNAALYMPERGVIYEPPVSGARPEAAAYYASVAREVARIIRAVGGRSLILFSSRAEMESVRSAIGEVDDIPILMQGRSGPGDLSEQFKQDRRSVLFGLRSFWTGFDAPGETLSCVALVRIPFEVPIDPEQVARHALIQWRGGNPFMDWTLPNAKQIIKQGAGRLLRRCDDVGIICILDARMYSKRYGLEIMANLPEGMRLYHDIETAVRQVGLGG